MNCRMMMRTYRTDYGTAQVEPSGQDFWLVTMPVYGHSHDLYVAAYSSDEAVLKACMFYYGKKTRKLERI